MPFLEKENMGGGKPLSLEAWLDLQYEGELYDMRAFPGLGFAAFLFA